MARLCNGSAVWSFWSMNSTATESKRRPEGTGRARVWQGAIQRFCEGWGCRACTPDPAAELGRVPRGGADCRSWRRREGAGAGPRSGRAVARASELHPLCNGRGGYQAPAGPGSGNRPRHADSAGPLRHQVRERVARPQTRPQGRPDRLSGGMGTRRPCYGKRL